MGDQPWLDSVREQLARHGLPPSYVQRFTEELGDHLDDLSEEGLEADASSRLGEPKQVANAAVAAYRRRSFLGRHPVAAFLVFAISPVIPQYVLFGVLLFLAVVSGYHAVNWHEGHWILSLIILVCSTFAGTLYCELAMWLGIGRKWALASCAVLSTIATLFESSFSMGGVSVMLLVQFAVPLAVGWWFTKRQCNHGYPATTLLVFAISPIASHLLLMSIVALAVTTAQPLFSRSGMFANVHYVPAVLLASSFLLLLTFFPTVVTSLFYCKLVRRIGIGRKWTLVSCTILAMYTAMLQIRSAGTAGLVMCLILGQALVPLAIAWWFMRRKRDRGQLELAS